MPYTETYAGGIVMLDLHADGTLRAGNIEQRYTAVLDGQPRPDVLRRETLTAEQLAALIPNQADLLLQLQALQATVATVTAERDAFAAQQAVHSSDVPTCSAAQARFALRQVGKLSEIEAHMAALPATDPVYIYWYFETIWRRDAAILDQLGPSFGLDAAAIDALFDLARTL